jgi:hypothetical protein
MPRRDYVFDYEAEPADERPTGYGETNFDHWGPAKSSTAPAPWSMSEHSTFEAPSRSIDRVQQRRHRQQLKVRLTALLALLGTAGVSAVLLVARPWAH